ncbi:MAG: large-conductance mechanosensitive channel protein MscL [Oscillospiraceae bacterium]|nr:large-conductance mechanosensitive channel protein MscL [Oscillospiraceae bacterium]
MKKFFREFKEFAVKGNVVDMAVGVVIGGAFGKIVTSLVGDVIMPAIGLLTGKINLAALSFVVKGSGGSEDVSIAYGAFLQNVVDFLIVALCIFLAVKLLNRLKRKKEEAPPAAPVPSAEEILLTEIRDLLKEKE